MPCAAVRCCCCHGKAWVPTKQAQRLLHIAVGGLEQELGCARVHGRYNGKQLCNLMIHPGVA